MENQTEKIWADLREKLSAYAELKWHLWRLMAMERAAGVLSSLSYAFILLLLLFLSILFLFVALGIFLGEWFGSMALGFLLVSMLYALCGYIWVLAQKGIRLRMIDVFINQLQQMGQEVYDDKEQQKAASDRTVAGEEKGVGAPKSGFGAATEN